MTNQITITLPGDYAGDPNFGCLREAAKAMHDYGDRKLAQAILDALPEPRVPEPTRPGAQVKLTNDAGTERVFMRLDNSLVGDSTPWVRIAGGARLSGKPMSWAGILTYSGTIEVL